MIREFVRDARRRVAAGAYRVEDDGLRPHGKFSENLGLVAEVKPRSPSTGRLRTGDEALSLYASERPDALSVLTDPDHFGGHVDLLRRAHSLGIPTLMKDFVLDEAQVICAAHAGASAVLLIERILEPNQREALVAAAHAQGMEVLLEVFDSTDWFTAQESSADVIGVNARNLDSFAVNRHGALHLLAQVDDRPALALSGIRNVHDVRAAKAAGASGALVGSSILSSVAPALALRSLRRPIAKVCGITHPDDLVTAAKGGADLVGFVVGAQSPRSMTVEDARLLAEEARSWQVPSVLVTPNATEAQSWAKRAGTDFVQCPGRVKWPQFEILAPGSTPQRASVVDTDGGGSGRTHDWGMTKKTTSQASDICLVAGGLDASNAADAVTHTQAWGADASSRLEQSPGRKDPEAVRTFIAAVRAS